MANSIALAYSSNLLVHLCSLLVTMLTNGVICDACRLTLDILSNIGHRVDIPGDKRQALLFGLEGAQAAASSRAQKAPLLRVISMTMPSRKLAPWIPSMAGDKDYPRSCVFAAEDQALYNKLSKCVLYVLCSALRHSDRVYVIRALDIINQVATVPANGVVMSRLPESVIHTVCNLLYCNTTTADPSRFFMDQESPSPDAGSAPTPAPSSNRLPGVSLAYNYYLDVNDAEMRDTALETLYSLSHYSLRVREVVAHCPLLLDYLVSYMEYLHKNNGTLVSKREALSKGLGRCWNGL